MINKLFIILFIIVFLIPSTSWAYLDPGTGSYILQVLAALAVGSIFSIRLFFRRIKDFLSRKQKEGK